MHAPREPLPRFSEPMLLSSGLPRRLDDGWALEVRWDGLRAQLCVGEAGWTLRSRPGRDCTADFAELADLANALRPHRVVLDGELVHLAADGKPDFAAISRRLVGRGKAPRHGRQQRPSWPSTCCISTDWQSARRHTRRAARSLRTSSK